MSSYLSLASVYDKWTSGFDYSQVALFLRKVLPIELRNAQVLDVCCGTATLAALLAGEGAALTGVDQSRAMLDIARERCQALPEGCRPTLILQNVEQMEVPRGRFHAAVSTLDSLNYFSLSQLARIFALVHGALRTGGVFVFDVNTPQKLREQFGNSVYAEAHDDYAYIWRNTLGASTIRFDIELFRAVPGSPLYERSQETHLQHIYGVEEVAGALAEAGFVKVETRDDYSEREVGDQTLRATFMGWKT